MNQPPMLPLWHRHFIQWSNNVVIHPSSNVGSDQRMGGAEEEEEEEENHHHVLHVDHLGHFLQVPRVGHLAQCYSFLSILYNWANATGR